MYWSYSFNALLSPFRQSHWSLCGYSVCGWEYWEYASNVIIWDSHSRIADHPLVTLTPVCNVFSRSSGWSICAECGGNVIIVTPFCVAGSVTANDLRLTCLSTSKRCGTSGDGLAGCCGPVGSIGLVTERSWLRVRLTPVPLQATLSKLLTYCVLRPTQTKKVWTRRRWSANWRLKRNSAKYPTICFSLRPKRGIPPNFPPCAFSVLGVGSRTRIHSMVRMIDAGVYEALLRQVVVRLPAVRNYCRPRFNPCFDNNQKNVRSAARDGNQAAILRTAFKTSKHPIYFNPPAPIVFPFTNFCLVSFNNYSLPTNHLRLLSSQ